MVFPDVSHLLKRLRRVRQEAVFYVFYSFHPLLFLLYIHLYSLTRKHKKYPFKICFFVCQQTRRDVRAGRRSATGNRVYCLQAVPRVRIPLSPPAFANRRRWHFGGLEASAGRPANMYYPEMFLLELFSLAKAVRRSFNEGGSLKCARPPQ